MNKGESSDVSTLLRWLTGQTAYGRVGARSNAVAAAARLADRIHASTGNGLTGQEAREAFPAARCEATASAQIALLQDAVVAAAELLSGEACDDAGLKAQHLRQLAERLSRPSGEVRLPPNEEAIREGLTAALRREVPPEWVASAANAATPAVMRLLPDVLVGGR